MSVELLARMLSAGSDDHPRLPISHVGQIASLREYCAIYRNPPTFQVGDLVTPRRSSCVRGHGEPHIVIEALQTGMFHFSKGEPTTSLYGKRLDIRVACLSSAGNIQSFWMERSDLEPFSETAAATKVGEPTAA